MFNVVLSDVPEKKNDLVSGQYDVTLPKAKTTVAVKIIDMLGEEILETVTVRFFCLISRIQTIKQSNRPMTDTARRVGTILAKRTGILSTREFPMLVLTRQLNKSIVIGDPHLEGDGIEITFMEIRGDQVRLGVQAPKDVPVHRKEIKKENRAAAGTGKDGVPNL